jgi:hypothetical protein
VQCVPQQGYAPRASNLRPPFFLAIWFTRHKCKVGRTSQLRRLDAFDVIILREEDITFENMPKLKGFINEGRGLVVAAHGQSYQASQGMVCLSLIQNQRTQFTFFSSFEHPNFPDPAQ